MDSPDPAVRQGVARDMVFLEAVEINPVVVHGGGKAISRAMKEAGMDPVFNQGHRVTCKDTVALVHEVLSHQINPEIVATINGLGGVAKGFPGWKYSPAGKNRFRAKMVKGWILALWVR